MNATIKEMEEARMSRPLEERIRYKRDGTIDKRSLKSDELEELNKEEEPSEKCYCDIGIFGKDKCKRYGKHRMITTMTEEGEPDELTKQYNKSRKKEEPKEEMYCRLCGATTHKDKCSKHPKQKLELASEVRKEFGTWKRDEKKEKEENKTKTRTASFLLEDRPDMNSLGCGFHNGVYYFGTKVYRDGKGYNAVVTSDKQLFVSDKDNDEIRYKFGLNYAHGFYDKGIDHVLSRKAITRFLYENTDDVTMKDVFEKFRTVVKEFCYLDDERKYSLVACYRLAGFFMHVWKARGRLFLHAEKGSGKSRLTNILHNTGFNSVALGDWTLPYIQRMIESTRGETHIDDYETLYDEKRKTTDRLIKVGYMKGFKAGKTSDGAKKEPEVYDLFNTTTLNNTEGLDGITTDRCVVTRIPKIARKEYDEEPDFTESRWKEIRDDLYILGLKYAEEVSKAYRSLKSKRISGRELSIIKPELTIAKFISEDVFNDIESFWTQELEEYKNTQFDDSTEFLVMKQIYGLKTDDWFFLSKITEPIIYELGIKEEHSRRLSSEIGRILNRNPIFKHGRTNGKTRYRVKFQDFIEFLQAKRMHTPIMEIYNETQTTLG